MGCSMGSSDGDVFAPFKMSPSGVAVGGSFGGSLSSSLDGSLGGSLEARGGASWALGGSLQSGLGGRSPSGGVVLGLGGRSPSGGIVLAGSPSRGSLISDIPDENCEINCHPSTVSTPHRPTPSNTTSITGTQPVRIPPRPGQSRSTTVGVGRSEDMRAEDLRAASMSPMPENMSGSGNRGLLFEEARIVCVCTCMLVCMLICMLVCTYAYSDPNLNPNPNPNPSPNCM